mmetsp:Transcript_29030/g.61799  ORF Transcript_29030/g.61799 Transcript_29030/m.61799 type:complete len:581 (-) Transcript_29030:33-1775(-)
MAKKKKGGNKKKKAAVRGDAKPSASDSASKKQSPPEEEKQHPKGDDGVNDVAVERLIPDEVVAAATEYLEGAHGSSGVGGAGSQEIIGDSNLIGDIKVEPPVSERVRANEEGIGDETKDDDNEDSIGGRTPNNAAAIELAPENNVDTAPSSKDEKDSVDPTAVEDKLDGVEESAESKDKLLSDLNHGPSSRDSDSANVSPIDNVEKEPTDTCSVDGADATGQSTEVESVEISTIHVDNDDSPQDKIDAMPTPGIVNDTLIDGNGVLEVLSDGDDTPKIAKKSFSRNGSQLSQGMEEVNLDSPDMTVAPLVRAFNGTPNGISPATHNSMSFTFKDSTEIEAFVFLTAALRESLGDDANGVTDETLCRYIRWKPDVKRAMDRFRAYDSFRKENSYIFDDKPLLLSQDPKLTFLVQNGFVIAPEELFAKDGSRVMIIRGAKCDITGHDCDDQDASRAIFYILQRMLERNALDPLKGITIVLDLAGAGRKNNSRRLANLLSKAAGCFPLRVRAIYVVSMPWWFPAAGSKKLFSTKMRSRIHFLKDKVALHEYIEKDRLLEEDGGIYNFDLQSWISTTFLHEVGS